jgi:hypothetical protein
MPRATRPAAFDEREAPGTEQPQPSSSAAAGGGVVAEPAAPDSPAAPAASAPAVPEPAAPASEPPAASPAAPLPAAPAAPAVPVVQALAGLPMAWLESSSAHALTASALPIAAPATVPQLVTASSPGPQSEPQYTAALQSGSAMQASYAALQDLPFFEQEVSLQKNSVVAGLSAASQVVRGFASSALKPTQVVAGAPAAPPAGAPASPAAPPAGAPASPAAPPAGAPASPAAPPAGAPASPAAPAAAPAAPASPPAPPSAWATPEKARRDVTIREDNTERAERRFIRLREAHRFPAVNVSALFVDWSALIGTTRLAL